MPSTLEAIKTARKYHAVGGHPERFHIITFDGAFHGRTLATIAAGGNEKYIDGFGPKAAGFDKVPFGDIAAARAAIGPQTAAILVEPIQGEGGIRVPPRAFLRDLRIMAPAVAAYANANAGKRNPSKAKAEGIRAGVFDLTLVWNRGVAWVEFKGR